MKPTWKVLGLMIAGCVLALSLHVRRATGQQVTLTAPATHDQAMLAVTIIREINTAEVAFCREKDGKTDENMKFLTWDELINAPCFKQARSHFRGPNSAQVNESFSPGPEIVPGLEFRLVISPDGKHYNLWLGQKREVNCGFAFYSDERGVIYEGKAIGCSAEGVLGKP
jgi:hypothetical protein